MLIIQHSDRFTIEVLYLIDNGRIKIGEGSNKASFVFRRPTWLDIRIIMSSSVVVSGNNGQALIDPYKMMDLKIKTLLCDWDLAKDGKKLEISPATIDQLDPALIQYLFDRVNESLNPEKEAPKAESPAQIQE